MIIKAYGGLPTMYAPDIGEVILARRSASDKFTSAVVIGAHRNRDANLQIKVQWLESDPLAVCGDPRYTRPVEANANDSIVIVEGMPPLVQQIDEGTPHA